MKGSISTLIIGLSLFSLSANAKPREWKSVTVSAIVAGSSVTGAVIAPVGTMRVGVKISTNCIGYRLDAGDTIYILEYCYNPMVQHPWPGQHSRNHAPNLTLNGKASISVENHDAHVLDDDGRDVKVPILEKVAK